MNNAEGLQKKLIRLAVLKQKKTITFGEYSAPFFLPYCKLTLRRQSSNKPISPEILGINRNNSILKHI